MTTIKEVLENISNNDTSTEQDEKVMMYILNKLGYTNSVIVCGVVYLEGKGTFENPPACIQNVARTILKSFEVAKSHQVLV